MLYLYTDPAAPHNSRAFFYHIPTHTFAEHFITSAKNHHLRVHQDGPINTDVMIQISDWLKASTGVEDIQLITMSGKVDYSTLPDHLILASASGGKSVLIHYPALGFTAGIHEDGSKIPPHWRDPAAFTREQRSHIIDQAAETLMQTIGDQI
jgi:hypothetical protein